MQCKKCGSEWKTNARASLIIRCPFCGAELEEEKEDKLTFRDAKEALRYIVKTYGVDVIIDGIQLRALLDEFIPDLKQERKVFMDAYEQGMCNALYLAHDESEIDKCIAILQSIKVLTTDACMAEKWASYVVECFVYALDWSVPMFGITPNIHMHQMPENIREPNRRLISAGDAFEENYNDGAAEPEKESRSSIFGFFHNDEPDEDGTVSVTVSEDKETAEQAAKIKDEKTETKPEEKGEKPQRPIFDFTDEAEEEKKDEKTETKSEESATIKEMEDVTEPKNDAQNQIAPVQNPWMQQMPQNGEMPQMPWGFNPWMQQMPQNGEMPQMPWGFNPWMQQMPTQPASPTQPAAPAQPATPAKPVTPARPDAKTETSEKKAVETEAPKAEAPKPEAPKPEAPAAKTEPEKKEETAAEEDNGVKIKLPSNMKVFTAEEASKMPSSRVSIPEGYEAIEDAAFSGHKNLESIELPASMKKIGEGAFENCTKLMTVNLPEGLLDIGRGAFSGCISLVKVTIPSTIIRIRQSTFSGCEKLKEFTIPSSVKSMGKHAFLNCESLTEVVVPDGVEELPENVFSGCRSLVKVTLPESVKYIRKSVFSWCEALTTINIPEAVREIGDGAFTGCSVLKTVNIPKNLESIGYGSFSKCGNLRTLTLPDTLSNIGENAFNGSNRTLVVHCSHNNSYVRRYCRMNRVKCKDLVE